MSLNYVFLVNVHVNLLPNEDHNELIAGKSY